MTTDVESEALHEFRRRFVQDGCAEKVSPEEAARVLNDDWWLRAFLRSQSLDVDVTKAVVLECIKWRMNFKPDHIGMLEMRSLLETGLMFIRGEDVDGNVILWINFVHHHQNGNKEVERLLIYWIERFVMETHGAPLAVVFNMHGAGLQNMDNNLIRFILHTFKYYYPAVVRSILILETPQKLNPSWKVVRSWVDSNTLAMMHTVTRHSLAQYVDPKYIPVRLGGEDDFAFSMDELARCIPSRVVVAASTSARPADNGEMTISAMPSAPPPRPDRPDLDRFANGSARRSVKFDSEDSEEGPARSGPLILANNGNGRAPSTTRRQSHIPSTLKPIAEARINAPSDQWLETPVLLVCPSEELVLKKVDGENDSIEVVVLKNPTQKSVMYKIKTTSPEKFRVRPTAGIVKPEGMEIIRVYLQNEYKSTVAREKFLIMAMETDGQPGTDDFTALWKEAPENSKILQKLRCRLCENNAVEVNIASPSPPLSSSPIQDDAKDLRAEVKTLANQQRFLLLLIFVLVTLQILSLIYNRFNYSALSDQIAQCMDFKAKLAKDEL
ncbi:hypothetical protein QR680_013702 [Steinernema hermaphroditum]|uniref:Major sperm protein n=1 Tax=Steinernema hermaphroditum TaxID=289476 RepID=A0AA39I6E1_9BILA|nr:hypothetical protein QR680_013702 [Steinernema hermaphroditum]